jgi:hypothetical protein
MKFIEMIIASLCVVLSMNGFSQAKEWRGIIPLHSTRADVERLLGPPTEPRGSIYNTENEKVSVWYSPGFCEKVVSEVWNVPRDTVISVTVYPKTKLMIADLQLDKSKYKKAHDSHVEVIIRYTNEEEGISIETRTYEEMVISITYGPTAKDNYLRCPAPAENPDDGIEDSRKFDEYSNLSFDEEKKHLNDFSTQLQSERNAKGYIIAYAGRRARIGEAQAQADRAKNYLVKERGIEARRIVWIDGGYREELTVELWVRPNGWLAPKASPTVDPSAVQIIKADNARNNRHSSLPRRKQRQPCQ